MHKSITLLRNSSIAGAFCTLLVAPLTVSAAPTQAGSWYMGLQAGQAEIVSKASGYEWNPIIANGRVGFFPISQLAIETRLGGGVSDDKANGIDLGLDHLIGAYTVVHAITFQDMFSFYFLGGLNQHQFEKNASSWSSKPSSELELSYGGGLDIYVHNNLGINIEYISYQDDDEDGDTFSAINAGVTWFY